MSKLVIVESPTKAKTISKFLSRDFKVESSFGHVRDLPASKLGVDVEHNFEPEYVVPTKAKKRVAELKKLADKADMIYFATDEDREGEAISWHLAQIFKTPLKETKRITFHEITEEAVKESLKNPRTIDLKLVDAQQARRVLDRLVGYELSPFLWKKIARGLSAGRVQSVAVRLIVEKERDIQNFIVEEYWEISGLFEKGKEEISAKLHKIDGKILDKLEIKNEEQANELLNKLVVQKYYVANLNKREVAKKAPTPFTTSSLQQEANRRLGFSAKQTMMLAQQLYEGIEIGGESTGLITYMRTDSLNLSQKFLTEAANYIKEELGANYADLKNFKTKSKGAQEAHEAIRPTVAARTPESVSSILNKNQFRLYQLIWQRSLASQMSAAKLEATSVDLNSKDDKYTFRLSGQIIKFDGFLKIYPSSTKDEIIPNFVQGEDIKCLKINPLQKFTQPPARYSDATLVKVMEEKGIGRPSTYAPTIATIIERNYVERLEDKRLKPTDIAMLVNDLLVQHFPEIVDFDFTAKMEANLDEVAEGEMDWQPLIGEFYEPFHKNLKIKEKEISKKELTEQETEEICEKCGSKMVIKVGRYGKFMACENYPSCKNTKKIIGEDEVKPEPVLLEEKCPDCGANLVVRQGRFGSFKGCSKYPECKYIKKEASEDLNVDCPVCKKGKIVAKRSRRGIFYACDQYPDCKTAFNGKPTEEKCPDCGWPMMEGKKGLTCSNKECSEK